METLTKQYTATDITLDEGSREVVCVISSDSVDRDQEVLLPQGLDKKNYAGNPVVMVNHDYSKLPIGSARWIKRDGNKLIAKFYCTDKTELGRDVFSLLQDGVLRAFSVGYTFNMDDVGPPTPKELKARPDWMSAKRIYRKWSLHEFSVVGIPANPDALTLTVAKGLSPETVKFLGDDFAPAPEVFKFEDDDLDKLDVKQMTKDEIIEAYNLDELPLPKFSKRWNPTDVLNSMDVENEILARLMGRP